MTEHCDAAQAPARKAPAERGETPAPTRQERRRAHTRARLVDAAHRLMAERGFTDVGIAEITAEADLGTGTFYNYFSSREEILTAVAEESMELVGAALDRTISGREDPAEVFAASLRHLVRYALSDQVWGWFLVRMGAAHPTLLRVLGPRAKRDLERGMATGRFSISDVDLATTCTFGSLVAAIQLSLTHPELPDRDRLYAKAMLCMVGVSPQEATRVVSRPLPELDIAPPHLGGDHAGTHSRR